jgi:hypothetical protein
VTADRGIACNAKATCKNPACPFGGLDTAPIAHSIFAEASSDDDATTIDRSADAASFTGESTSFLTVNGTGQMTLLGDDDLTGFSLGMHVALAAGSGFGTLVDWDDTETGFVYLEVSAKILAATDKKEAQLVVRTRYSAKGSEGSDDPITVDAALTLSAAVAPSYHVGVVVLADQSTLFVDGKFVRGLDTEIQTDVCQSSECEDGQLRIGQGLSGEGAARELQFFREPLTELDMQALAGVDTAFELTTAPGSECRCPAAFPRWFASQPNRCFNIFGANPGVARLNTEATAFYPGFAADDDEDTWWLSTVGEEKQSMVFDLNGLHSLYATTIDFVGTLMPKAVQISVSSDGGHNYSAVQFYADSKGCNTLFETSPNVKLSESTDVTCLTAYSRRTNPEGTQLHTDHLALAARQKLAGDDADEISVLSTHFQATHVRIDMAEFMIPSNRKDLVTGRFYAIAEVSIDAACECYGHASDCIAPTTAAPSYACKCDHNTTGVNCGQCKPLYNSRPWAAGVVDGDANECLKCECNEHSLACVYDADLDDGVCQDCNAQTTGNDCGECNDEWFLPKGTSIDSEDPCTPCECSAVGSNATECAIGSGQCSCKANVSGRQCDICSSGFYNFTSDGCVDCNCDSKGVISVDDDSNICDEDSAVCRCKQNVKGDKCDSCKTGFYDLAAANEVGCTTTATNTVPTTVTNNTRTTTTARTTQTTTVTSTTARTSGTISTTRTSTTSTSTSSTTSTTSTSTSSTTSITSTSTSSSTSITSTSTSSATSVTTLADLNHVCGDELLDEAGFYALRSDPLGIPCAATSATAALEAYFPFTQAPNAYSLVCVDNSYMGVDGDAEKCAATADALNAVINAHVNGEVEGCNKVSTCDWILFLGSSCVY